MCRPIRTYKNCLSVINIIELARAPSLPGLCLVILELTESTPQETITSPLYNKFECPYFALTFTFNLL